MSKKNSTKTFYFWSYQYLLTNNYLCSHCPKRFKNTQGLSVLVRCTHEHNVGTKSNQSNKLPVTSHKSTIDDLISDVTFVINSLIKKFEENLQSFSKLTGKYLCQSRPETLLRKRIQHRYFPVIFAKFS